MRFMSNRNKFIFVFPEILVISRLQLLTTYLLTQNGF